MNFRFRYRVSAECQDLIQNCLRVDTGQRATLQSILRHPWLKKSANSESVTQPGLPIPAGPNNNQYEETLNSVGSNISTGSDSPNFGLSTGDRSMRSLTHLDGSISPLGASELRVRVEQIDKHEGKDCPSIMEISPASYATL